MPRRYLPMLLLGIVIAVIAAVGLSRNRTRKAAFYFNRGVEWTNKGEHDKAIADFTEAIRIDPKLSGAYSNRGSAWDNKGEHDKAIADYTEAIRIDPRLATAYSNRGLVWEKKGALDKAIADCTEAIRIDPKIARAYNHRGTTWINPRKRFGSIRRIRMLTTTVG